MHAMSPWLLALLVVAGGAYLHGVRRAWRCTGPGRSVARGTVVAFAAGLAVLVLALASPLQGLGTESVSAHVAQRALLALVAAPLLIVGRPLAAWRWALEPAIRQSLGCLAQSGGALAARRALSRPAAAFTLHALALWVGQVPAVVAASQRLPLLDGLQQAGTLAAALLLWHAVVGDGVRASGRVGAAAGLLVATWMQATLLAVLLGLSTAPWYGGLGAPAVTLGIDPLADQRLAGLLLWAAAACAYGGGALVLVGRSILRPARPAPGHGPA